MKAARDVRVTMLPGVTHDELLHVLTEAHTGVTNLRGRTSDFGKLVDHYLDWVDDTVRMLRYRVHPDDIDRLVLTRRYWAIQTNPHAGLAKVVNTEIDDREADLHHAIESIRGVQRRWQSTAGKVVVADTSVFCQHPDKFADLDLAGLIEARPGTPFLLMLPILVLEELEGLKQSNKEHIRWRALHTLGRLDEVLLPQGVGLLHAEDATRPGWPNRDRGPVRVEVVFDPPGHRRLPINDDELIDRALAIEAESGREVTFLTYDTAQSTRARFAGLNVRKLTEDPGPESQAPQRRPKS